MKPIRLKFSGLQSYREEQDINFEELGIRGIFGVFGPTGGGKSTILDAITLALFGKVERAKSGTRGILNQSEKKLQVSFEFALGTNSFLVERLYERDRNDAESVRNKNSRLIDLSAGNFVLADKATDVDAKVVELLGMSFEDFSRGVVLPQGKFDQFLKLTGGERAKMLEHIFFLERYGEGLSKKVTELERSLEHKIDVVEKLIYQLGDASREKIQDVEVQLGQQKKLVQEKELVKKRIQNTYKELEELQRIYNEISFIKQQKDNLEAEKPLVEQDKLRLDKAIKAESLRGLLKQVEELEKNEAADLLSLKGADGRAESLRRKCEVVRVRLEKAVCGEVELNRLREELPKIALALDLFKRSGQTKTEIARLLNEKESKTKFLDKLRAEGQSKNELLKKISDKIQKLKTEQNSLAIVTDCRIELEKALTSLVAFETAEGQEKEAIAALEHRKSLLAAEEKKFQLLLAENLGEGVNNNNFNITEGLKLAAGIIGDAVKEKTTAEKQLENIITTNMAGALAGKLTGGEPCPVCGSTDHPKPAGTGKSDGSLVEEARKRTGRAAERLEHLRNWESELKVLAKTIENLTGEIAGLHQNHLEEKARSRKNAGELFLTHASALAVKVKDHAELPFGDVRVEAGQLNDLRKRINAFKEVYESAQGRLASIVKEMSEQDGKEKQLISEVNELRAAYREGVQQLQNIESNLSSLRDADADICKNIDLITGGRSPQDYEKTVTGKIDELQAELNSARLEWDSVQKEVQESEKELTALRVAWEKCSQHLSLVRQQLEKEISKQMLGDIEMLRESLLEGDQREEIKQRISRFEEKASHLNKKMKELAEKVKDKPFSEAELVKLKEELQIAEQEHEEAVRKEGAIFRELEETRHKHSEWLKLSEESIALKRKKDLSTKLSGLLKGRKFIQFLAEEHLADMTAEASLRLASLTGQRYALELDESGNFVMRDDYSGGLRRPVSTLSGGETFLTSLSMALALSSKIQLKGKYPLGFFFLDEGFGTLDPEKLEVVMNTLERLHDGQRTVGVITHVQELRTRMPRYLEVIPAAQDGTGSRVLLKKN